MALDYIGKRGNVVGATKEKRIAYARDILQKELLPHVGIEEKCEKAKARRRKRESAPARVDCRS